MTEICSRVESTKQGISVAEKFLFYFAIFDVLFLPYVWSIATTYTQILALVWLIVKFCSSKACEINRTDKHLYISFLFFVIACTATSVFFIPIKYTDVGLRENILRAIQVSSSFGYLFLFIYGFERISIRWDVILWGLIVYVMVWGIIYVNDFSLFLSLKQFFNSHDSIMNLYESDADYVYRFSFIWTDPNNISYAICSTYIFLVTWRQSKLIYEILGLFTVFFICTISMSTGGFISLLLCVLVLFVNIVQRSRIKGHALSAVYFLISILVVGFLIYWLIYYFLPESAIDSSLNRFSNKGLDTSRLDIWSKLFTDKLDYLPVFLFYGMGYQVYVSGEPFNVHNGHFLLIFAYGFIGYLCYMLLLFRKPHFVSIRKYLFMLPFFLGFTINTYIGEAKAIALVMMLIALMRTNGNRVSQLRKHYELR